MKKIMDVTLVGSGIIGLLTAKALVSENRRVQIIEQNSRSLESSWAGGGILLPLYPWRQKPAISTLVALSLKLYPLLSTQLQQSTPIDPEWTQSGLLISQNPDIEQATNWCQQYEISYQRAEASLFHSFETESINPLWLPEIAQARNPRLLKSLRNFLAQTGQVEFIDNCTFENIVVKNQRIDAIETSLGRFKINHLLLATGAWTGQLTQKLFPKKPPIAVRPMKGQMLLLAARARDLDFMILAGSRYLIPRKDGKILVGSTVEQTNFDKSTTIEARETLHQFALKLMPNLKKAPIIGHWAGLRPATEQGVPYIDHHPQIKNLSINAGHFRNGLVMAPASAQLMTDLMLKRTPSLDPKPYQLTRTD
jgi:glycine oxidase